MNVTRLRYVAIAAPEFERSRAFFTAAWGLHEATLADGIAYLRTQSDEAFQLALVPAERRKLERLGARDREQEDAPRRHDVESQQRVEHDRRQGNDENDDDTEHDRGKRIGGRSAVARQRAILFSRSNAATISATAP